MRGVLWCGLVLVWASAAAQKAPDVPPAFTGYGPPKPVELALVAYNGRQYHRVHVSTTGELRTLASSQDYFVLADGRARLLLIPARPDPERGVNRLLGRRIQLTGLARVLPSQQDVVPCRAQFLLESLCEDPELPALPDARIDWPSVSITYFSMSDIGSTDVAVAGPGGLTLAALATDSSPHVGKTVTVVGLFAGRNLFADLPAGSERTPADWVLKVGAHAIWVTAKPPEGKGFRLDPTYRGDTKRWLQVTGRVEATGHVTFLRASKIVLTSAPKAADEEP
jgi:hypothetical protein